MPPLNLALASIKATGGSTSRTLGARLAERVNVKDYGAVGDGVTDDTTAITNAIAAVTSYRGVDLVFEPGVYLVPAGITETKPGLVVRGRGHRTAGPGQWGDNGVVLKATTAGAWVWTHDAISGNDYDGGRFENITFKGDADTAGGLRIRRSWVVVHNCGSCLHTTGIGFLVQIEQTAPGDDSSWNIFQNCVSQDDLVGFQTGTSADVAAHPSAGTSTEFHNCVAQKTSAGGINNTGTGIIIWDNATSVFGGKFENNNIGISVPRAADGGTGIFGARCEANATYDISLNRASGTNGTRNLVVARANNILVGAFQVNDTLVVNPSATGTITDNGTDTVIFGNAIVKTTHAGAGTPSGGFSGEIRVGNGKLWAKDGGTWKSVTIT